MSVPMVFSVAAGGALGSVARYLTMILIGQWFGTGFPYGTLVVNILGSFVMGVLVELGALVWSTSLEMRAFLTVGILGGFTTFSTFSLDVVVLVERHDLAGAVIYVTASVLLSVAGLFGAMGLIRAMMS